MERYIVKLCPSSLPKRGIGIGLINYQDTGNWGVFKPEGPTVHLHIFGRAKSAVVQKYGDAVSLPHLETGFYEEFKPLTEDDAYELSTEIDRLMKIEKYRSFKLL